MIEISFIDILKAVIALLIIAIAANVIARYLTRFKLPLITGFIIIGVLAGSYILKMLPENIEEIKFIEDIALGFIAFAAGTELYLKEIRSRIRNITIMAASQFFITFIVAMGLLLLLSRFLPIFSTDENTKIAIILLISTIFIARSPASAIAIISELRAKGPYTTTALGVTVLKDVFVMMLFTITFGIAQSLVSGIPMSFEQIIYILLGLILTIILGLLYAVILKMLFKVNFNFSIELTLFLLIAWSVLGVSNFFNHSIEEYLHIKMHIEPLFAGVVASFYITNYSNYRLKLQKVIEKVGNYVYVIFFTFIGATLAIDKLTAEIGIIILLFFIRLVAIMLSAFIGSTLNKDPWNHRLLSWTPYITQAGVSLGLIAVVASEFSEFGGTFETLMVAVIIINQFVGPPLMKWAIIKVGESHVKATHRFDGLKDVFIIGLEGISIALAKTLKQRNWNVKVLTDIKDVNTNSCHLIDIIKVDNLDYETLEKNNFSSADSVVLLKDDSMNLRLAELIYEKFGTPNIIVRVLDRAYINQLKELDVIVVEPASALVNLLEHFVVSPNATSILLGREKGLKTDEIEVINREVIKMTIRELRFPLSIIVINIYRNGVNIIPHGDTELRIGDILTVVGNEADIQKVRMKLQYTISV